MDIQIPVQTIVPEISYVVYDKNDERASMLLKPHSQTVTLTPLAASRLTLEGKKK